MGWSEPIFDERGNRIGIACGRGRRVPACSNRCGRDGTQLCDYPLTGKQAGHTCDRRICKTCATKDGEKDFCPPHAKLVTGTSP